MPHLEKLLSSQQVLFSHILIWIVVFGGTSFKYFGNWINKWFNSLIQDDREMCKS